MVRICPIVRTSGSCRWAATSCSLISSCRRNKVPRDYLHWLFTKLPTVTAPNAGHFNAAACAALRTKGALVAAVARRTTSPGPGGIGRGQTL
ncbi:MAG: hypothetical protein ACKV19_28955 [Verrucomicrobiales bacterium]